MYSETRECHYCHAMFIALSKVAKYCCASCRTKSSIKRKDKVGRFKTLAAEGKKCFLCKTEETSRWFTREVEGEKHVLCGKCFSTVSRDKFYQRVPNPGKGYAKKIMMDKKVAKEEEERND